MRTIVTIKDGDIIVTTKKGDVSFYKMYEDLENKASKTNIVAWVAIAIGAALVVPVSISQLSLNEIKEQTAAIKEQNSTIEAQRQEMQKQRDDIQKQRDLIYALKDELNELEKELIRQSK